jgi:catechol 2,3-dioxygenase-like lactoylglutathione lyase family enzyme
MTPEAILETVLYCPDLDAAERFYTDVFELPVVARAPRRHLFLRVGPGMLLIFNAAVTASEPSAVKGQPIPLHGAYGAGHMAFRVPLAEIDGWRQRLEQRHIAIESEVVWPRGGHSLYLRDPAGNCVEIATRELWGL